MNIEIAIKEAYNENVCNSIKVTFKYLLDFTDCTYRNTKSRMRRHNMNTYQEVIKESLKKKLK